MGTEKGIAYYDKVYIRPDTKYATMETPKGYSNLWSAVVDVLDPDDSILDIGCGVGQFAHYLAKLRFTKYVGVDFSGIAIGKAKKWVPQYNFYRTNVFDPEFAALVKTSRFDKIVCLETLEHITRDLDLISMLEGHELIFSVPNFDCASHVRHFKSLDEIEKRYWGYMDISGYVFIQNKFHLVKCMVK